MQSFWRTTIMRTPLDRAPQTGNSFRFVSCVHARSGMLGEIEAKTSFGRFPFCPGEAFPFPLWDWVKSRVSSSEIKWNNWNQVKKVEINVTQLKSIETKWNQVRPSEVMRKHPRPSETKWNQVSPSETKWNRTKENEAMWKQASPIGCKWVQTEVRWV